MSKVVDIAEYLKKINENYYDNHPDEFESDSYSVVRQISGPYLTKDLFDAIFELSDKFGHTYDEKREIIASAMSMIKRAVINYSMLIGVDKNE